MSAKAETSRKRKSVRLWLITLGALALPWIVDSFGQVPGYILNLSLIFAIVAVGLNLLTGFSGQVSLGHASFVMIGSYTSAILTLKSGMPFWGGLLAAGILSGGIGFLVGLPAVRLTGNFLAVATLGFGLAVPELILKWTKLTNGDSGLSPARPSLFGFEFNNDLFYYYMILICLAFTLWVCQNLLKGKAGRAFQAIRDSEVAATAMGISLVYYKALVFAISAAFAGVAGSLYAHYVNFISPNDFTISSSFLFFAMVVLGGLASLPGSILGAVLLTIVDQLSAGLQSYSVVVMGAILVAVVLFFPKGLTSLFKRNKLNSKAANRDLQNSLEAQNLEFGEGQQTYPASVNVISSEVNSNRVS